MQTVRGCFFCINSQPPGFLIQACAEACQLGASLLRSHANAIGLEPSFTIHDRQDSQDLMNLVRHERGFSEKDRRFPLKDTCLAIYSRAVNAGETLEAVAVLMVRGVEGPAARSLRGLRRSQAEPARARL